MDLDMLVSVGQRPWQPVPDAHDVDVWDKYDFPNCGTYRLGDGTLVIFTLITTAGARSLWAYIPVPLAEEGIADLRFDSEADFDAFLENYFIGREAVFAVAEDFVITAKSDAVYIQPVKSALLAAAVRWYAARAATLHGEPTTPVAENADRGTLLRTAQGVLTGRSA